jgi:hypothetical protein
MKKITIALFCLVFFIINSCEKNAKQVDTDNIELKTFQVKVQKFSNNENLFNFGLCFLQTTWITGKTYKDSVMFSTKTDTEGKASFKIKYDLIKNKDNVFYYIVSYRDLTDTIPDSSSNNWKYSGEIEVYNNGDRPNSLIQVEPRCKVNINSDGESWGIYKIDSIIIFNKNYFSRNLYNQWQTVELLADCSESNTIKYYYYSNAMKSKDYYKEIYIPFNSRGLNISTCTLDFK